MCSWKIQEHPFHFVCKDSARRAENKILELVSDIFIPSRNLSYLKIVKVEGRKPNLFEFYAKPPPIFYKYNESRAEKNIETGFSYFRGNCEFFYFQTYLCSFCCFFAKCFLILRKPNIGQYNLITTDLNDSFTTLQKYI